MRGASTCCAQPCSKATRPRFSPWAPKTRPTDALLDHLAGRRAVLLQHRLYQINPAPRTIQFIAEQHISRTGRGAKSTMHAGAQDLVGFRDIGIGELSDAEFGLHVAEFRLIRPRLRMFLGSKLWRTRSLKAARPAGWGWNTSTLRRSSSDPRTNVA